MPRARQVVNWFDRAGTDEATEKDREFLQCYARARELQADFFVDEIVEIADDKSEDPKTARCVSWSERGSPCAPSDESLREESGCRLRRQSGSRLTEEKQKELQARYRKALERFLPSTGRQENGA